MTEQCKGCRYRELHFSRCSAMQLRWAWNRLLETLPLFRRLAKTEACDWMEEEKQ